MARQLGPVCRHLLRDRRGMSSLEFAVVALVLVPAVIALVELGNAAQQQIQLQQALRAGGQYATSNPGDSNLITNAQSKVTAALPSNWTNVTVGLPTKLCKCWSSGSLSPCAASTPLCPGKTTELFLSLTASTPYTGTFLNTTISSNHVARYQ